MEGLWGEGQGLGPVERNPMVCLIASGGWLQVWMDVAWEMEFSPPPHNRNHGLCWKHMLSTVALLTSCWNFMVLLGQKGKCTGDNVS